MPDRLGEAGPASPFESASELKEAHGRLLERLDRGLGPEGGTGTEAEALAGMDGEVREFLERGSATGAYLEETKERTACQVLLDYWESSLSRAGIRALSARLARFDGQQLPDLKDKRCPYVGLEAFRERDFFFGRDEDTRRLLAQVREAPLSVVTGTSGSGKSSLVMGGLVPALKKDLPQLAVVGPLVPGIAVLEHLARAVAAGPTGPDPDGTRAERFRKDPSHLATLLGGHDSAPVLVVIDQFEEVFTLSEPADRDTLAASLGRLLQSDPRHRVVLTMREEFKSRIVQLGALGEFLDKAWFSMRPMGYEALRKAVEGPAALVNLQFRSGIVDDLVKKVLGQPAALPLLQFTLRALWSKRDRNRITWEVYREVGDPLTALRNSADEFYDGLTAETQDEVKRILLELVRVDELLEAYRQPVPVARLRQAGRANTMEVIDLLVANDYVRITPGAGDGDEVVEVKHESLVRNWPRLVAWIDEKRIERRQRLALTQAADRWAQRGKPVEGYLTGWQVEEAKLQPDLSPLESEFVQASADAVERGQQEREEALRTQLEQQRRRFRETVVMLVLYLVASALTAGYFWYSRSELAKEKAALADENKKLETALNATFANELRQAFDATKKTGEPPTIYLHISVEKQRRRAEEVAEQLRRNQIVVPGIQRVNTVVSQSNVRFFHDADAPGADDISRLLTEYLGGKASIKPTKIPGYEDQPRGRYEIWFAPDALANPVERVTTAATPTPSATPPGPGRTVPNDPLYAQQWSLLENGNGPGRSPGGIGLERTWNLTKGSRSVVVAVVGTGIVRDHPDITGSGNLVAGYDMVTDSYESGDGDGRDADATDPGECGAGGRESSGWDGTHNAGIVGTVTTNNRIGMAGMNWLVRVQPVRALSGCGSSISDVVDAIRWAAGLAVPRAPRNATPARIILLAAGMSRPCSDVPNLQKAIGDAVAAGATVVVPAGNEAVDAAGYSPASCEGVITAAASDARGHLVTRYSNYGARVDIMAPGGDPQRDDNADGLPDGIISTVKGGYAARAGTSLAAAHVAGVAALLLAREPTLTPAGVRERLKQRALPRSNVECPVPCGAGLLSADLWR